MTDPGDQERGSRKRPAKTSEPDLFNQPTQPTREKSEGEQRKEKALEKHETSGRAPLLRFLRRKLRELYAERKQRNPYTTFVTADDAVRVLEEANIIPQDDAGEDEPRYWLGALFKEEGWKHTGRSVPSLRKELNGRHVRCWRWEGE